MAVVVVVQTPGGNADFYEQVMSKVAPGGQLPDGMQAHIAGPIEGGWRVITAWESEDHFHRFREEKLIPAIREAGGGDGPQPNVDIQPLHNLISA
jgi:hypothetical protein